MSKDGSRGKCLFERVESIMIGRVEISKDVLPDEMCQ